MFFNAKAKEPKYFFFVIDDEEEICEILAKNLLNHYDCRVEVFGCCNDALQALATLPVAPDVILSDVVMPGMSGFSLSAALKQIGLNIPVILITGLPGEEIDDKEMLVVSKPFSINKIVKLVDRFL